MTMTATFEHMPKTVAPGKSYSVDVLVEPHLIKADQFPTQVVLTVSGERIKAICDDSKSRVINFDSLQHARTVAVTLTVPSDVTSGKVDAYATIDAQNADPFDVKPVYVTVKKPPTHTGGGTGTGTGTGGSTSGGVNTPSLPTGNLPTGGVSPTPTGGAVLPSIPPQQPPTTAPDPTVQQTSSSQSMRSTAAEPDEMTFDKLASTQAAWLAALLVAFSLLLTQLRLGKAGSRDARSGGSHRRPRRQGPRAH